MVGSSEVRHFELAGNMNIGLGVVTWSSAGLLLSAVVASLNFGLNMHIRNLELEATVGWGIVGFHFVVGLGSSVTSEVKIGHFELVSSVSWDILVGFHFMVGLSCSMSSEVEVWHLEFKSAVSGGIVVSNNLVMGLNFWLMVDLSFSVSSEIEVWHFEF